MSTFTKFLVVVLALFVSVSFAAPKSPNAYYSDAAFQYIESRLPTAEITCKEGLSYYPSDSKLQMLLDRIQEAKDEQKNQNKKDNQDQNKDKNKDQKQDQNKDQQQNQDQNQDQNKDKDQNKDQNKDQDKNQDQKQDPNPQQGSSSSQGSPKSSNSEAQNEPPQQLPPGALNPEQASQLLKDFDEQNGERKPWKPVRGTVRPEKDW